MRRVLQKPKNVIWTPHPGSQVDFLECPVHEVLLHGNRGGGKTDVLLMDFLQDVGQGYGQDWRGILFREEYTQLTDIINKSKKWVSQIFPGAKWNGTNHSWVFPEGETLYLRYMRVPGDYWGYHGHEYPWCVLGTTKVLMSDMLVKPMMDVRVGDYVHTLEGPKKVLRVTRSTKDAVKLNFYSCGELVGTQVQGLEHRLLTTDGMLDVSTLDLNHAALQSQLFQSAWSAYKYPEYSRRYTQLLLSSAQKIQNFLEFFSLLPTYLDTQVTLSYSYQKFLQSWAYQLLCMSYRLHAFLNLKIQENYAYVIDDHSCRINTESILQDIQQFSVTCSHFFVKLQGLLHQRISFPAFCYGYNCDNAGLLIQDYLTHCLGDCSHNDAQVHLEKEIFQDIVPQFYDAPKHIESALFCKDDLVNTQRSNLPKGYVHPYSGEFRSCMYQTSQVAYPLAESPIHNCDLIDITVADCSHYITELSVSQLRNEVVNVSHRNYLINKNCGWEELTNWATDECYKIMMSTNRSSNPSVPRKVRATCNPAGVGHAWVKHRFIDVAPPKVLYRDPETGKGRVHIVSSLAENTTLLEADPNYQKTIISAVQDDPAKRKAWIEGSWDIIDGGFFSDLWKDGKTHIIKKFPFPKSWDVIRSFDWGSSKPWSVTYVAESNGEQPDPVYGLPYLPKGSCICIMEIYGWNGTVNTGDQATSQDIAERTLAVDAAIQMEFGCRVRIGPADTSIWEVRDGTSIAKNMSDHGLWWHKAYKGSGSRVSGWAIIRTMLGAANRRDLEHPHLYFFETCRHHIRTIQVMQHDKNKPEDLDSSLEDHCMDSLRYGLARKLNRLKQRKVRN